MAEWRIACIVHTGRSGRTPDLSRYHLHSDVKSYRWRRRDSTVEMRRVAVGDVNRIRN